MRRRIERGSIPSARRILRPRLLCVADQHGRRRSAPAQSLSRLRAPRAGGWNYAACDAGGFARAPAPAPAGDIGPSPTARPIRALARNLARPRSREAVAIPGGRADEGEGSSGSGQAPGEIPERPCSYTHFMQRLWSKTTLPGEVFDRDRVSGTLMLRRAGP